MFLEIFILLTSRDILTTGKAPTGADVAELAEVIGIEAAIRLVNRTIGKRLYIKISSFFKIKSQAFSNNFFCSTKKLRVWSGKAYSLGERYKVEGRSVYNS